MYLRKFCNSHRARARRNPASDPEKVGLTWPGTKNVPRSDFQPEPTYLCEVPE